MLPVLLLSPSVCADAAHSAAALLTLAALAGCSESPARRGVAGSRLLRSLRGGARGGDSGIDHSRYQPPDEWAPLSEPELLMLKRMRGRFREHEGVHDDLLLEAIRGFEHAGEQWADAADAALEQMVHKRAAVDADGILTRGPPRRSLFCSLYLCGHHGYDRDGHPLYFERTGALEPKKLFGAFAGNEGEHDLLLNHVFVQEMMRALKLRRTAETGRRIYKHIAVTDLSGLSPAHLSKQLLRVLKRTMAFHEAVYPETLYQLYIVNAPGLFAFAWKLVSPWLHPLTAAKVKVLGRNFIEQLRADGIEPDQVPAFLGGGGGELEQFWEPLDESELPALDHYLQTTLPGAGLQDIGDAAFDEGAQDEDADISHLRVRHDDAAEAEGEEAGAGLKGESGGEGDGAGAAGEADAQDAPEEEADAEGAESE
ncbi:CRAL-TRIO domain-containing protein [Pavlovales sp. CCMP2436]|nr:CRAL-TRIO domain-containing protein [Pavlovales sp. CCMP2436]